MRQDVIRLVVAAIAAIVFGCVQAATLVVDTIADPSVGDGACSLREAIQSIDNGANAGDCVATGAYGASDTINFNIPGSGVHTIALASALPQITKPMVLDAFTQLGASPNSNGPGLGSNAVLLIEIDATNMGNAGDTGALTVGPGGGGTTIRGFVINRQVVAAISLLNSGGGNTVEGNYIGVNAAGTAAMTLTNQSQFGIVVFAVNGFIEINDTIGGTTPAARNVIAGEAVFGEISVSAVTAGSQANGATIEGNFIGTNAAGTASLSLPPLTCHSSAQAGISVGGNVAGLTIGGGVPVTIGGATYFTGGNVISGNCAGGIHLAADATGTAIQGNLIGTDVTGTVALGNLGTAVELFVVPGATTITDNVISAAVDTASNGEGIDVNGSNPTTIARNKIGTDITGTANLGNQGHGIGIANATSVQIDDNVIAFNGCCELGGQPGVFVASGSGVAITGNSIFSNQTIGIDLAPFGPSPNGTATANGGQTFPVITAATSGGGSANIQGTLESAANTNYQIEFFSNAACDPTGFGEGQTLIGTTTVLTDGSGHASFDVTLGANASVVTATATSVIASVLTNTSEFSACVAATPVATPTTTTLASSLNPSTFGQAVTFTATVGGGSSPGGTVQFMDGATNLGAPVTLSGGVATFTTSSLAVGTHPISAVYSGDTNNAGSTSNTVNQVVNAAGPSPTTTTLVSSLNPAAVGQAVTFTATVNGNNPTGTVQFRDGAANLGAPAAVSGGVATLTTSTLALGTHPITAAYGGDAGNAASTSSTVNEVIVTAPVPAATQAIPTLDAWGLLLTAFVLAIAAGIRLTRRRSR